MPVTPPRASLPVSRKRAATPGPSTENKHARLSQGNQLMNGLNKTMNRVTDVSKMSFRHQIFPSTPVRLQTWCLCNGAWEGLLTPKQLVKLVDVFERMPHAAVSISPWKITKSCVSHGFVWRIGIVISRGRVCVMSGLLLNTVLHTSESWYSTRLILFIVAR